MKYQLVPMHEKLLKTINEKDPFTTKIQIGGFGSDRFITQDDHLDNTENNGQTQSKEVDNSEDGNYNELYSSQQLDCMKSNTMFHQENQILLTMGSSKSTTISIIKPTGMTSTSTFLQSYNTVSTQSCKYYCVSTTISPVVFT